MSQKKKQNGIANFDWYSLHVLAVTYEAWIIDNGKLLRKDVVDEFLKEWWVDNKSHYSLNSLESLTTFRSAIAKSKKVFYLLDKTSKDKLLIIFTEDEEWYKLLITKNKEVEEKPIKTQFNDFESILNNLYSKKYKEWIQIDLSEDESVTSKMRKVTEYLK